ncbi:MAG TPA: maleylacetate reductase [Gemmatimonadaceae bacterium]|nr:maleylacetate reductase [Gemmatimonadaceae bacterium]
MKSFTFESQQSRVIFGAGCLAQLPLEVERLGAKRVMLVATPGRSTLSSRARDLLPDVIVESFDRAAVHVPQDIALAARDAASSSRADLLVALGGGSAIGVAKAIALSNAIPILAVPTTYGGSEMTPIWGLTEEGRKETGRNSRVQPRVVIYDSDLTLSLPARTTACSGLNAIAHCVEALYASDSNSLTTSAALEGLRLLVDALPRLAATPEDREQRSQALKGAWLAGFALGTVQMALHHKLCHTLGGSFSLPHAETHAVLLPYTAAYNRDAAGAEMRLASSRLEVEDLPAELLSLARSVEAPLTLQELGMKETDLDRAADLAVERQYPNPAPVTRERIRVLLDAAYRGDGEYVTSI